MSSVDYSIDDSSVGQISSSGLITALQLGQTVVTAKSTGIDPDTGKKNVYSQVNEGGSLQSGRVLKF